jgi:hypothetical protein
MQMFSIDKGIWYEPSYECRRKRLMVKTKWIKSRELAQGIVDSFAIVPAARKKLENATIYRL